MTKLLSVKGPCKQIIDSIIAVLLEAGYQVSHTFSLQSAIGEGISCSCSYQAGNCDCGMDVFLVYGSVPLPATLVAHSYDGRTWFSLANTADEAMSPELGQRIQSILAAAH